MSVCVGQRRHCCVMLQVQPIRMGLKDAHPYVRRTAVMGVLKVYNIDKSAVRNAGAAVLCPFLLAI